MPKSQMHGHLAMLLYSFFIAGSFSLGGDIAHIVAPEALTTIRFFCAALVMGILSVFFNKWHRSYFKSIWRFPFLGAIFAVYFVTMFEALKLTTAVSTAAVSTLTPLIAAGFGYLILSQTTTKRMISALIVGAIGAIWVIFRADFQALLRFDIGTGELIFLIGTVAHALYAVLYRKFSWGEPVIFTSFGTLFGGGCALLFYSYGQVMATAWQHLPLSFWLIFAYLVFITSSLTFFLIQYAALRLPSAKVMAYTYILPCWVILWEWARQEGLPGVNILAGVGLTVVALFMLLKNED